MPQCTAVGSILGLRQSMCSQKKFLKYFKELVIFVLFWAAFETESLFSPFSIHSRHFKTSCKYLLTWMHLEP